MQSANQSNKSLRTKLEISGFIIYVYLELAIYINTHRGWKVWCNRAAKYRQKDDSCRQEASGSRTIHRRRHRQEPRLSLSIKNVTLRT